MPSSPNTPGVLRGLQEVNPNYPDPEQFQADPNSNCVNPKCDYQLDPETQEEVNQQGRFVCPRCGTENIVQPEFNPGGRTLSGLSLDQMGNIGETLIARIGEIPGVGSVESMTAEYQHPIDCIVVSGDTRYGCEIKTNHAQAQPRFKLGDQKERHAKIAYCAENGLQPALIGVRLNFFNDKANIFFRPGMSDTWIGNSNMKHVGTVDFEDLNPFKGPPGVKQQEIEHAGLPDQSNPDEDIDAMFGPTLSSWSPTVSGRAETPGTFKLDHDIHEIKILDKNGKATHFARYCTHCGHIVYRPVDQARMLCPTCGEDPDRKTSVAKVYSAKPGDPTVVNPDWNFTGYTPNGHRKYKWVNPQDAISHTITLSSGRTDQANKIDMHRAMRRMQLCESGRCDHLPALSSPLPIEQEPGTPIFRAGQVVALNGTPRIIVDIDGEMALVQDMTGKEDIAYLNQLQNGQSPDNRTNRTGAKKPDFMFVYYNSALKIVPWHHNIHYDHMLEDLLKEYGYRHVPMELDPGDIDAGEIFEYQDGSLKIEHKQLSRFEIREEAETAISLWMSDKEEVLPKDPGESVEDEGEDEEGDSEAVPDDNDLSEQQEEDAEQNATTGEGIIWEHWRRLPRDDDGLWQPL